MRGRQAAKICGRIDERKTESWYGDMAWIFHLRERLERAGDPAGVWRLLMRLIDCSATGRPRHGKA